MLAIHDRVTDDFSHNMDKFPNLKGLVVSQTFNFNNLMLVEHCAPLYLTLKTLLSVKYSMSDLKGRGIVLETKEAAESLVANQQKATKFHSLKLLLLNNLRQPRNFSWQAGVNM